jgi:hypothetical protein
LIPNSVGPCMIEDDGTPIYCDVNYFGEQAISAAAGDLDCPETVSCSNEFAGVPKLIEVPINAITA